VRGLSEDTHALIERMFPPELRAQVVDLLTRECGNNLPFAESLEEYGLERVRFAALKMSGGDLDKLRAAVEHAKIDSRDVLMGAGFGDSLTAHKEWARLTLGAS